MWSKTSSCKKFYIPDHYYTCIQQIPFDFFAKQGIKALFFDLDNTLVGYKENALDLSTKNFLYKLTDLFKVVILSNASKKRLQRVLKKNFNFFYLNLFTKKPSPKAFQKSSQQIQLKTSEILMIGDQLHTDINGANQAGLYSLLVKPLNRQQESLWTKFNRFYREKSFLKKIKEKDYQLWKNKFQDFEGN